MIGTIKRLIHDRYFGFIRTIQGGEYFFHASSLKDCKFVDLHEGMSVDFDAQESNKGPRAENVMPLGGANESNESN